MQENPPVAVSKNAPPNIPKPLPGSPSFRTRSPYREAVLFAAPVECIVVGTLPDTNALKPLAATLTLAGVFILLTGLLADHWILARSLKPISHITLAAHRIAEGQLAERIPIPNSPHLSELNQLARTLNTTFAQLDSAFARQTRFTTDAAHELRTPVAVLLTQTQSILARERSPEEYREALQACLRAAHRMRTLSESLLQLSRSTQPTPDTVPVDLAAIGADCLEFSLPLAAEKSIRITRKLSHAPCLAHPDSLARALSCLLENAVEYTPESGSIRVTTSSTPHASVLQIANSGPGIPPEELPLIFEAFHRTEKSRTSGHKIHCGLGLPIAKNLLETQGATLEAASTPSVETVFTIRFTTQSA
jgi:signal transduction histidine kinase